MEKSTETAAASGNKGRKMNSNNKEQDPIGSSDFSELEMDAAEQLIQLSGSISDNNSATEESDGKTVHHGDHDQVCSSKYRTSRFADEVEDDDGDDVLASLGPSRKKGRYRSISELYELTKPLNNLVNVVNYKRKMRAN
ncbi:uncharacterized protein LOC109946549 [Prunus persica]|uniref:uncharacterized protein LOC109946549 n=1 Tax=Prunus persica TaxID=3760 RepID=UPI0009AB980B|nr:uncharacterized protein LOC109946549 [Prunus persica]